MHVSKRPKYLSRQKIIYVLNVKKTMHLKLISLDTFVVGQCNETGKGGNGLNGGKHCPPEPPKRTVPLAHFRKHSISFKHVKTYKWKV